jgi:crotonobetainyl-CoA:carnitine CoA-transferase CaiB-like acyl-CoA transferase
MTKVIGLEDLVTMAGYATRRERTQHGEEIEAAIQSWVGLHTIQEVESILNEASIPYGQVMTLEDVIQDPHLRSRGRIMDVEYQGMKLPVFAPYPILSATPGALRTPWPQPGQHNEEIYCGILGMSREELTTLKSEGVI